MNMGRIPPFFPVCFQLDKFVQRYKTEGPGTVGLDLDRGAELMETYGKEFDVMEKQRVELGKYQSDRN